MAQPLLSHTKGRLPEEDLWIEPVRPLVEADLPALLAFNHGGWGNPLTRVRAPHHQLAQLLAKGLDNIEVSLISGYDPAYISKLKGDPAFAELLAAYEVERKEIFVDTLERMKITGLMALEDLNQALTDAPEKFTNREKMDLVRLLLVDPAKAGGGAVGGTGTGGAGGASGSGVVVNVQFIQARGEGAVSSPESPSSLLDLEAESVEGEGL